MDCREERRMLKLSVGRPRKGFNEYKICGDYTIIYLKQNNGNILETLIDTEDLQMLIDLDYSWHARWAENIQGYYARTTLRKNGKINGTKPLHRLIMNATKDMCVDHRKPRETLDNRKRNLRVTTTDKNLKHRKGANKNNKSGYRNVTWSDSYKSWIVQLYVKGKNMVWRGFSTPEEANEHAIKMRLKYYGKFCGES